VPLGQAVQVWETDGRPLAAYLERIVRFSLEENDTALARRAAVLMARTPGSERRSGTAELAILLREGNLSEARAFVATGAANLPRADQSYVERVLTRMQVSRNHPFPVPEELPDGRLLRRLSPDEVRRELMASGARLSALIDRPPLWLQLRRIQLSQGDRWRRLALSAMGLPLPAAAVYGAATAAALCSPEVASTTRPGGPPGSVGWTASEEAEVRAEHQLFVALAGEAVIRGAPLRAWATEGRYAPMIFRPLVRLMRSRHSIQHPGLQDVEGETASEEGQPAAPNPG
jgi:hypothetical protein